MKKGLKIAGRVLLGLALALYVLVATLNYSVVQSVIGVAAGKHFSQEWGGEVSVGSISAMPWNHFTAHNLLLVSPDNDTILQARTLRVHFSRFPFHKGNRKQGGNISGNLELDRVYLADARYHLQIIKDSLGHHKINLSYIIDNYRHDKRHTYPKPVFIVDAGSVTLRHVDYRMDLPDSLIAPLADRVAIRHMEYSDVCAKMRDVHVANDDVTARIVHLSTMERSGFKVEDIKGEVHVGRTGIRAHNLVVHTPQSHIDIDAELGYDHWHAMKDYCHTVEHHVEVREGTSIALSDVAYWVPRLAGFDQQLSVSGRLDGTVANLRIDSLRVADPKGNSVEATGLLEGVPELDRLAASLDYLRLHTSSSDLQHIASAAGVSIPPVVKPWLQQAGALTLSVHGQWAMAGRTAADATLVSSLGTLNLTAQAHPSPSGRHLAVEVRSPAIALQPLHTDWLSQSGVALSVHADMPRKPRDIRQVEGKGTLRLTHTYVRGQHLAPIDVQAQLHEGVVQVKAHSADSLAHFDLDGRARLGDSLRGYYAELDLQRLQADRFGLIDPRLGMISGRGVVNVKGNTADELQGGLTLQSLQAGEARIEALSLTVLSSDGRKDIRLESAPVSATMGGHFAYADLPLMVQHLADRIVPPELRRTPIADSSAYAAIKGSNMNFNLQWNDNGQLLHAIAPKLTIAHGTRLSGSYNHAELLKMALRSDSVRVGGTTLTDIGLNAKLEDDTYQLMVESPTVKVGRRELLHHAEASLTSDGTTASAGLKWGNGQEELEGDLMLCLAQGMVSVAKPNFRIGNSQWTVGIDSLAVAGGQKPYAEGHGISLRNEDQSINARLRLRGADNDHIELDFDHFMLDMLSQVLLPTTHVDAAGRIDGHFSMYGFGDIPYFNANLTVDSCVVNHQQLGHINVRSNWNAELNTLNLQVGSEQLNAQGWVGLGERDPELNFTVDFDNFELAMAAPFMSAFAKHFGGQLHGNFDIGGTISSPVIVGEAKVEHGQIQVEATGVTYHFSDSLFFAGDLITLKQFHVSDNRGNTALVNGNIRYVGLNNVAIDLGMQADQLLVLDRPRGNNYNGTLLMALQGAVQGTQEDMHIALSARTLPGCKLTVPISSQRQVKTQNYITFVNNDPQPVVSESTTKTTNKMPVNIELDLSITPDLELHLPIDFSEVAVNVGGSGYGDLHLSMAPGEDPKVMGNYVITSGLLRLSMISVLTKNFTIESGSNLGFQGSLPDARFDLKAVHSQRVNLSTLTGSLSSLDNTQKYLQVENVIAIAGTLREPTVGFDIRLPNADASVEEEVFAYIDRNSERDMVNQTMSLLLRGQFYNNSNNENGGAVNNGLASGYSMIASSMSSIVSDMVQFVDVDVNYKAGNDLTKDQLDVNISKDWGKWYIESTLGYGGESREIETGNAAGTVIDALIGYRLSPLVHLFAYNRTNTNDYTRMDLPYKQGAGLKLTKDFDRWYELIGIKNHKKTEKP